MPFETYRKEGTVHVTKLRFLRVLSVIKLNLTLISSQAGKPWWLIELQGNKILFIFSLAARQDAPDHPLQGPDLLPPAVL